MRIFRVTGTSTAATTRSRMRPTSASSDSSAEPAATLHTFFAGQPMLMSMTSAPRATLKRAASASRAGSDPAICTDRGAGSPEWSIRSRVLRVARSLGSLDTISDTVSPAPSRRQSWRNGRSVTPAMGASTTRFGNRNEPVRIASVSPGALAAGNPSRVGWRGDCLPASESIRITLV